MRDAKVIGKVWLSKMHDSIKGFKILILCESSPTDKREYFLAVDTVDAGAGDRVLTVSGSAAKQTPATKNCPSDTTIVGIIDPER